MPLNRTLASLLLVGGLTLAAVGADGRAVAASSAASTALQPDVYGEELPAAQVLPVRGVELPVNVSAVGQNRTLPSNPAVQAIPTPTACEAGGALLAIMVAARCIRRRPMRNP